MSKTCQNFKVYQPRCKPVGDGKSVVGKIFNDLVRDSILPVYKVKNFEACPNIIEASEGAMAPTCGFF